MINDTIACSNWQRLWERKCEGTSSSITRLRFDHYMTWAFSRAISNFQALKTVLAFEYEFYLDHWTNIFFRHEKNPGGTIIENLIAILLIETDFADTNKEIFGTRMIPNVGRHIFMPEEIFSNKGRTSDYGTLAKALCFELERQSRRLGSLGAIDASNCFNSITHDTSLLNS